MKLFPLVLRIGGMAFAVCGFAGTAQAGLIGDQFEFSFLGLSQTATVNPTADFVSEVDLSAVVADNSITLLEPAGVGNSFEAGPVNDMTFTDLTHASILDVTVASMTGITGFKAPDLSFTDDSVTLNVSGLTFAPGAEFVFDVDTIPVPEPDSLPLLLAGLSGLAFAGWLRHKRA